MRRFLYIAAAGLLLGCSERSGDWPTVLSSFASGGAVHSLSFYSASPGGSVVNLGVFPAATPAAACTYYEDLATPRDFWYLSVELTSAGGGTYDIVSQNVLPPTAQTAQVRVIHVVQGDKKRSILAKAGNVAVTQAAAEASEWPGGPLLLAHLDASFSESPWTAEVCQGGQAPGQVTPTLSCTCVGPNGAKQTCTPVDSSDDCCGRLDGAMELPLAIDIQAPQCPWMCRVTSPDLARLCIDIQE